MVTAVSEGAKRWPVLALAALGVAAPFNIRLGSNAWTDLQLRILVVVAFAAVLVIVVQSFVGSNAARPDWVDAVCLWWLVAVWFAAVLSQDPLLGSGGAARLSIPILLLPAVRRTIRSKGDTIVILRGVAIGTLLGAVVGLVVWLLGQRLDPTGVFVGQVTSLGPFPRLTRPWAHANVAAMAIGATLVAATTLRPRPLAVVALLLTTCALVLTISRGGLLAGVAVAVTWVGLRRRSQETRVVLALVAVGVLTVVLSSAWTTRVDQLGDEAFYDVALTPPTSFSVGGPEDQVIVGITNRSSTTWPSEGDDRVLISARWFGPDGMIWTEDKWRLPADLEPGESLDAHLSVTARLPVGEEYRVRWDLHIPDTAYFGQFLGLPPVMSTADIVRSDVQPNHFSKYPLVERSIRLDRIETWRLAWNEFVDNPVIGVGPNQFGDAATQDLLAESREVGSHAHNIVLEPLATWGLLGALPFFGLFGVGLLRSLAAAWRSQATTAVIVACGLVAVAVHGLVDWPLVVVTTGIPVGLLMGIAWAEIDVEAEAT